MKKIFEWLSLRKKQRKEFNELHSMSDAMLKDIGLSRGDIYKVVYKNHDPRHR